MLIQRPQLTRQKTLLPAIRRRKQSHNKSNQMTLSQAKLERVEQLIYGLSQHPLALYSHFEESLPAEVGIPLSRQFLFLQVVDFFYKLFEEIVNLIDPEMNRVASKLANEQVNDGTISQNNHRRSHASSMSRDSSAPIREKRYQTLSKVNSPSQNDNNQSSPKNECKQAVAALCFS
jgi:hypothetical protein